MSSHPAGSASSYDYSRQWLSAAEIAAMKLPALPHTKRKINERARRHRWHSRARYGRAGGKEFPIDSLPPPVRDEIYRGLVSLPGESQNPRPSLSHNGQSSAAADAFGRPGVPPRSLGSNTAAAARAPSTLADGDS